MNSTRRRGFTNPVSRREVCVSGLVGITSGSLLSGCRTTPHPAREHDAMNNAPESYPLSLAQWSLHRTIRAGELDPLDFPVMTREVFGLGGVEYVNTFFKDKAGDRAYLADLRRRAEDHGVRNLLIMIDGEGDMGDPDPNRLRATIENHRRWLEAARTLDCHCIRVNAQSSGTPAEQRERCIRGFEQLLPHAEALDVDVVIENHGGLSSNGAWLADLVGSIGHPRLGTLPDFGNFVLDWSTGARYDRYRGLEELLPFARAVSAKSHDFDDAGEEVHSDFGRIMDLVRDSGYRGWVGIEYEGETLPERDGILRTRSLLLRNGCRTT